jgi:hypothetical protein
MVVHADALGLLAAVPVMVREVAQPGEHRLEHGHVDLLAAAGLLALELDHGVADLGLDLALCLGLGHHSGQWSVVSGQSAGH